MKKSIVRLLCILMAFIIYSVLCRYFLAKDRAVGGIYLQLMLLLETIIMFPMIFFSKKYFFINLNQYGKNFVVFIVFYMIFESINTMIFSPSLSYLRVDAVYWLVFISFFAIGTSEYFWRYFSVTILIILVISSILSINELATSSFSYVREITNGINQESYLYDIQIGFTPCTFALMLHISDKDKYKKIICFAAFAFYLYLQFYFQKRLPLARLFFFILIIIYFSQQIKYKVKINKSIIITTIIAIIISINLVPGDLYRATINRFFEGGSAVQTIANDGRYIILNNALEHIFESPRTILIGEGLGGCAIGNFGKYIEINGDFVPGLTEFEIGWASYMFRYGLIFIFIFYVFIFNKIRNLKQYRNDKLALACWTQVLIFFVFSILGESFPNVSVPLSTALFASSLGYLSHRKFNRII